VSESFLDGKVTLHRGDCLEVLPLLEANSIDSCVTDPPYHLTSIVKRFAKADSGKEAYAMNSKVSGYGSLSRGFMGKQWDGGDIAFRPEIWAEVLRVLKPGAHLLAFSSTRTYHRMACAIEDAGFEIRDQIGWCYGSGFPKSHDISKGLDKLTGRFSDRKVVGSDTKARSSTGKSALPTVGGDTVYETWDLTAPCSEEAIQWQGWGTALKPAWEPICLARKPLSESSIAANVLKHGTGGINVDGCRIEAHGEPTGSNGHVGLSPDRGWSANSMPRTGTQPQSTTQGRWPANLIHDGSEEVLAGFPETQSGAFNQASKRAENHIYGKHNGYADPKEYAGDSGSAARFFYTAKADADDRLGSKHPTVKPLDLMQYLVRLVTPKGGTVLDPFSGTGTTGEAAWREGFRAVLTEREAEYQADIVKRMGLCLSGPEERRAASVKQLPPDDLPMFGGGI
jgi:DNA modification methylase